MLFLWYDLFRIWERRFMRYKMSSSSASSCSLLSSFSSVVISSVILSSLGFFSTVSGSFLSLGFLFLPSLLGQQLLALDLKRGLVTDRLLLLSSGLKSEGDFDDCEESFLLNSKESFFFWFVDINNFSFLDFGDLVKSTNFSFQNLSNPKCSVDKSVGSFDGHKGFTLSEEKSEGSGNIAT